MRHYESLDMALADLREPSNVEIEGFIDVFGKKFYISGKTYPVNPPSFCSDTDLPKEMYKFWIEERKVTDDSSQRVFFPDT